MKKQEIKMIWNKNHFLLLTGFVFLLSLFQRVDPKIESEFLYVYKFGVGLPWITLYKNTDEGICFLLECLSKKGYLGIEWMPQNIVITSAFLYLLFFILPGIFLHDE